jgi:hypothetical protein
VTPPSAATVWRVRAAFLGLIVWAGAMIYVVAVSANPPIVSRPQVLSADAVVEGVLEVGNEITLKPDKVLWSRRILELTDFPKDGILIAERATWVKNGMRAIAPIEEVSPGRFSVQAIPFEVQALNAPPAPIYPASEVVRKQLEPLAPKKMIP